MSTKYIDFSQDSNGSGSYASPYNTLAELNALSGDQSNDIWLIKAGEEIRSAISLGVVSNLLIGRYSAPLRDSDANPIINATTLIAGPWIQDQNAWYIHATVEGLLIVTDLGYQITRNTSSIASLSAWEQYFDSGNNRLYLQTDGTDPNNLTIEINDVNAYGLYINGGSDITVSHIHCHGGYHSNFRNVVGGQADVSNIAYFNCIGTDAGGWDSGMLGNGFSPNGQAALASGHIIKGCKVYRNTWNAIEMSYLTGLTVDDCYFYNSLKNALELWNTVESSVFNRVKANGFSKFWWLSNDSTAYVHDGNTLKNCIGMNGISGAIDFEAGDGNVAYNNTFHAIASGSTGYGVHCNAAAGTLDLQNNIFIVSGTLGTSTCWYAQDIGASVINNNIWYAPNDTPTFFTTGGSLGISGWNTATGGTDKVGDPGLTDYTSNVNIVDDSSLAAYENTAGTAALVTNDYNNNVRYGGIDIGALQLQRHTDVSVSQK